jgi:hypothetical protein
MKARTIVALATPAIGLAFLQLMACLWTPAAGVACGALLPLLFLGILRFFEIEAEQPWLRIGLPAISSAAGVLVVFAGSAGTPPYLWFAPLLAALVAAAVVMLERQRSSVCGLCNRRIGRGVAFACPRCGLLVCERQCWDFEHCRCRLCEQNRVPILPPDGRWWDRHLGARAPYGRCQICMATAADADLRPCGRCGRPQCRSCWDYANGQCSRCRWLAEDLPPQLREYMAPAAADPSAIGK